jgi:hypothetical protein
VALLRAAGVSAAWLAACAAIGGCAQGAPLGRVEVWLRDDGAQPGEYVHAQAFIDPSVSRYAPHGYYAYAELPRADGTLGVLEIDVPTDAPEGQPLPRAAASYRELSGTRVRFESRDVRGRVVVPDAVDTASDTGCACEDSGFSLTFDGGGEERRLSFGRMGWQEPFCRPRAELDMPDALALSRERCAPAPPPPSAREPPATETAAARRREPDPPPCVFDCHYGHASPPEPVAAGGCGSDGSDGAAYDESDDDAQGCGGGDDDASRGGCEGDTADDSETACGGGAGDDADDASDESTACTIAPRPRAAVPYPHRGHRSALAGTVEPLLAVIAWQALRARRLRGRRRFATSAGACQSPPRA